MVKVGWRERCSIYIWRYTYCHGFWYKRTKEVLLWSFSPYCMLWHQFYWQPYCFCLRREEFNHQTMGIFKCKLHYNGDYASSFNEMSQFLIRRKVSCKCWKRCSLKRVDHCLGYFKSSERRKTIGCCQIDFRVQCSSTQIQSNWSNSNGFLWKGKHSFVANPWQQ